MVYVKFERTEQRIRHGRGIRHGVMDYVPVHEVGSTTVQAAENRLVSNALSHSPVTDHLTSDPQL